MKRTIFECDCCGIELTPKDIYNSQDAEIRIVLIDHKLHLGKEAKLELCEDCRNKIIKRIGVIA